MKAVSRSLSLKKLEEPWDLIKTTHWYRISRSRLWIQAMF